jgi:carnitine-CoA ligase
MGTCGKPRPGMQVRLVDANDCEVPVGATGELLVRSDRPWALSQGYNRDAEATARAWRNGWFHTGDVFRQDEDGNFFFVDRLKDAIRRRGENISSFEVELEVCSHPSVREAVAVAVPSEDVEDEVLIAVVPQPGVPFDPVALTHYLIDRMPHFMVPRYVRVMEAIPKTPTEKIEKHRVRSEGVTSDTWDRVSAGIALKRERLS